MKDAQSFVKISFLVTFLHFKCNTPNLEYTLKILANFRIKTQKSTDSANTFSKNYSFGGIF